MICDGGTWGHDPDPSMDGVFSGRWHPAQNEGQVEGKRLRGNP